MLTQDLLNELFSYDPETGAFERKVPTHGNHKGPPKSYPSVLINGSSHSIHRLIWLMVYGELPQAMFIDHIDGDRTNNRLSNLRLSTRAQNVLNRAISKNNTTGFKGVRPSCGRFRADIQVNGKRRYLGHFDTAREAALVYDQNAAILHGEFARTNAVMGLL